MNTPIHRLSELSFKYLQEDLTEEENQELNAFLNQSEENRNFFDDLTNRDRINEDLEHLYKMDSQAVWETVVKANPQLQKGRVISFFRPTVRYAAAIILIAALGSYWLFKRNTNEPVAKTETKEKPVINDVQPGQYKATLTLADGSVVVLDTISDKQLVQQGGTNVYTKDGKLIYEPQVKKSEVLYNTLTTAKGEIYTMLLADGSKVWLNSQSSLRYPVAFVEKERRVEITGEAYFEVTHDAKKPFHAVLNGMDIQVLGTKFNVNGYDDEDEVKTTLLEGKVKIVNGNISSVLAPGQQAQLKKGAKLLMVMDNADMEQAVAWKNGFFQFNDDDLKTVMRQLERWYDVEVIYQGGVSNDTYGGRINRNSKASEVLMILERNRVHFKIQGKKVIVTQ
jgi:ferric-dicitrate binding protein FerR (iron transport regulator)